MKFKKKMIWTILFVILIGMIFVNAGRFLVLGDHLHKSDAIIVLSGDRGERIEKAAKLYKQGFATYFVISGGTVYHNVTMAELMEKHAIELGVPKNRIIIENRADSTYENAHFTRMKIKSYPIHSAIVVSSDYHMLRVQLIFNREFKNTGMKLLYTGAKDPEFNEAQWWSSNKSIMITLNEYIKLIGYALGKNY